MAPPAQTVALLAAVPALLAAALLGFHVGRLSAEAQRRKEGEPRAFLWWLMAAGSSMKCLHAAFATCA